MNKWDRARSAFSRAHDDLFDSTRYDATFINTSQGTWDPDNDTMTGETENTIGTVNVEIVPPSQDTSIDLQGTDFDWSTSIRFPIGSGDLTVQSGTTHTIPAGETERYSTVTVESNATLVVNGKLVAGTFTNNGTVDNNGSVLTLNSSGPNAFAQEIKPLGDENERPTEVEIQDQLSGDTETFELHSYTTEIGSGMVMCRLQG